MSEKAQDGNPSDSHASGSPALKDLHQQFLDSLHHDLKTPLIGSREILQLMLGGICGNVEPEIQRLLVLLKSTNEDFLQMLEAFIAIYHYQSGPEVLTISRIDPTLIMESCLQEMQTTIADSGMQVRFNRPQTQLHLLADAQAVKDLLSALLVNCIKHQRTDGQLTLNIIPEPDDVLFVFGCDGLSISKGEFDMLFLKDCKHGSSKSHTTKAGLELHLCYQIVKVHQGSIEAYNTDGGLTLAVRLPR
jgi:two-component system NarL family sensor kinase